MRQMGIRAQWVKPHIQTTIRSDFSGKLKNLLDRNFSPDHPNCVLCTDITYIHTRLDGFVNLACIMDLYSRGIISWKLTKTLDTGPILESIKEVNSKQIRTLRYSHIINGDSPFFLFQPWYRNVVYLIS